MTALPGARLRDANELIAILRRHVIGADEVSSLLSEAAAHLEAAYREREQLSAENARLREDCKIYGDDCQRAETENFSVKEANDMLLSRAECAEAALEDLCRALDEYDPNSSPYDAVAVARLNARDIIA